jgi:hypothetical protein
MEMNQTTRGWPAAEGEEVCDRAAVGQEALRLEETAATPRRGRHAGPYPMGDARRRRLHRSSSIESRLGGARRAFAAWSAVSRRDGRSKSPATSSAERRGLGLRTRACPLRREATAPRPQRRQPHDRAGNRSPPGFLKRQGKRSSPPDVGCGDGRRPGQWARGRDREAKASRVSAGRRQAATTSACRRRGRKSESWKSCTEVRDALAGLRSPRADRSSPQLRATAVLAIGPPDRLDARTSADLGNRHAARAGDPQRRAAPALGPRSSPSGGVPTRRPDPKAQARPARGVELEPAAKCLQHRPNV